MATITFTQENPQPDRLWKKGDKARVVDTRNLKWAATKDSKGDHLIVDEIVEIIKDQHPDDKILFMGKDHKVVYYKSRDHESVFLFSELIVPAKASPMECTCDIARTWQCTCGAMEAERAAAKAADGAGGGQ